MKVLGGCLEDKLFEYQGHTGELLEHQALVLDALCGGRRLVPASTLPSTDSTR